MADPINVLSLCYGYAGIERGLESLGLDVRPVAFVEREAFAAANLVAKMEAGQLAAAPLFTDLKAFPYGKFSGCVDILTAGYPCQPFSAAGKRRGEDDPRHLWPHIRDGIRLCGPDWVFCENVEGHISLGLSTVISDLEELGYRTAWGIFSAAEVGAAHQRKRVFILAHSNGQGLEGSLPTNVHHSQGRQIEGIRRTPECSAGAMADTQRSGRVEDWERAQLRTNGIEQPSSNRWPSRPGEAQQEWEEPRVVADSGSQRRQQISGGSSSNEKADGGESDGDNLVECEGKRAGALADGNCGRQQGGKERDQQPEQSEQQTQFGNHIDGCDMADTTRQLRQRGGASTQKTGGSKYTDGCSRQIEPELGGTIDGAPGRVVSTANRVDRLRLLGNGVVAQTAAKAFATLYHELTKP